MSATTLTPAVTSSRRGAELLLLVLGGAVFVGAYAAVGLAVSGRVPPNLGTYGAFLGGLLLVAHVVVRRTARYADPVLLPVVGLLNGLGLAMIHRLDLASAHGSTADDALLSGDALAQLTWMTLGVALFVVVLLVVRDHRTLQRWTYTSMVAGIALLLLPLVPGIGRDVNGSRIWIRAAGFSFQPGEAAKVVLMLFFAGYLVVKRDVLALAGRRFLGVDLPRARDLGPLLLVWVACLAILVLENDLGTSVLFFGSFVMLLYVATQRRSWLLLGGLLLALGGYLAYGAFGHVQVRVDTWLHPFADAAGRGYQLTQGLYGFGAGGILGTGLGQGNPQFVPLAKSDFIVASFGEELGLTGLMAILLLYGILVERGLRTAIACRDAFGKLLAAGLSFILGIQVFVVVGGVTRLIPLTGLTTPFLSYGGSSLVVNWMIVALLLRMSDAARRPAPAASVPSTSAHRVAA
ncbi:cell elongation-specific peptidoglycan biosynthesis regulator RodA [Motilibacter rhizosphaerae]|uniref:peptidoglycan glycosyltransferase n=1 Tax=Motilibacter rhizosphaerae TaxID=598652 RepID=A0A4Q7NVG8_9ACTN|nr:FtsW/RodA/SpoVE family cell cycle protein [Motilibacter rhizosphaerae]RZS91256.1 cell elongation-specific peptidoglycan biosynthesis regulator RodA [Motilibacter rhizosphaerae]